MLNAYRRHTRTCRFADRKDPRRYKTCDCPIWVQGSLRGEYVKKALNLTSWEAAANLVQGWEASGEIGVVKPEVPDVREAVQKFLADCESRQLREASLRKYRLFLEGQLLSFTESTGRTRLKQLTVEVLREFRSTWTFAPTTHQKRLETLKSFLRFCETAGWIRRNPGSALRPPKVHAVPTLPFSEHDVQKLLDATEKYRGNGDRLRAMILLLRYSGLRISDAVTLKRDRLEDGRLFLYQAKTGQPVCVPVPDKVSQALKAQPGEEYVFWTGNGKVKSVIEDWRRMFYSLGKHAGVPDVHFHRFRDLFSVSLLEQGVPVERVAMLLGNSPTVVLKHYRPWVKSLQEKLEEDVRRTWLAVSA